MPGGGSAAKKSEKGVREYTGPASNANEALDRVAIPQDALDRISELMSPGASLIISDQGLGPETGNGTEFVVVLSGEPQVVLADALAEAARCHHARGRIRRIHNAHWN